MQVRVEKIDHVHIYVADLEKAMKFFEDTLGLKFIGTKTWEQFDGGMKEAFAPPGILLIQGLKPDSVATRTVRKRGEGLQGISLKVPNIKEAIAELQSKGMRLLGLYEVGRIKEALFHPKDSFGVLIELSEYSGEHIFEE